MQLEKVKLSIEMIVNLLNAGYKVGEIAHMTGNGEYAVRYHLRKHGARRVVRWEFEQTSDQDDKGGEHAAANS